MALELRSEVCLYVLREAQYFSFCLSWDTVGHGRRRGTRGTREGHKRCTRGEQEVYLWAIKGTRYFSF